MNDRFNIFTLVGIITVVLMAIVAGLVILAVLPSIIPWITFAGILAFIVTKKSQNKD